MSFASVGLLAILVTLAAFTSVDANSDSIPTGEANQSFFALAQSIIFYGSRRASSCGADFEAVNRCIKACNSPGLNERSGCCCLARTKSDGGNEFFIGRRGGCRYNQKINNFTDRFIYESEPIVTRRQYFDEKDCAKFTTSGSGSPCTCSISYEAEVAELDNNPPLPTPSTSPTPEHTASPTPTNTPSAAPPSLSASPLPSTPSASPSEVIITESPVIIVIPNPVASPSLDVSPSVSISVAPTPTTTPSSAESSVATGVPSPSVTIKATISSGPNPSSSPVFVVIPGEETPETPGPLDPLDPTPTMLMEPSDSVGPASTPNDASQSPEQDDGSVCVDQAYLEKRGFGTEHFVHKEPLTANVLCPIDSALPCGTAEHKVRIAGQDMSYKQMCARDDVQCRPDAMKVNSVYTDLWEEVDHDQVRLTMFDVRYAEAAQKGLHRAMRGLRTIQQRVFG